MRSRPRLTDRERAILPLLAHGLSREQAAGSLGHSVEGTKTTVQRMLIKMRARNIADAVRIGYVTGLLAKCGRRCEYCEIAAGLQAEEGLDQ